MRIKPAAFTLILALAVPAQGEEKESWDYVEDGRGSMQIVYGIPESEAVTIAFWCEPKRKRIEIVTTVLPSRPRKGQPLKTTLSNGTVTAAYDGKIGQDAGHETFHFAATTPADPKVLDVVRSGTSLTIGIPGKRERVPLRGIAKPLARYETACFGKR